MTPLTVQCLTPQYRWSGLGIASAISTLCPTHHPVSRPHPRPDPPSPPPLRASARTAARALSVLIMDSEIETINSAWLDSVETGKSEIYSS